MIAFTTSGSTKRTESFLRKMQSARFGTSLDSLAQKGVTALQAATPADTGLTAASWSYEIEITDASTTISWINSNHNGSANIAILIQYGHGTGTGGFVSGRDFINPAIRPIFDEIADEVWRQVTSA